MEQKIIRTGNSLAITIPASFSKTLGLRSGQLVSTKIDMTHGSLIHNFPHTGQLPLFKKGKNI